MKRVAIYARYSSDLQKETSIEDQVRLCEERAAREGWQIINCYTDPALSGSNMMLRPGVRMLMQDAIDGKFEIILSEALDRLSRDQADMAVMYKRLNYANVNIVTLTEGEVGIIDIGLKGLMNQLYIVEMAKKVKRGQRGRIEAGKVTAGLAYGYNVVKKFDARGEPIRGEREINEEQAAIVRRIFTEYADGRSPKAIAAQLNEEGVRSPTGKGWNQSSINGRRDRGYGLLNNHIYIGELVWNRVSQWKCPDTGSTKRRLNPEEEWIRNEAPELRILDQDLWDRAKVRQAELTKQSGKFWTAHRPRYLLSGLLKCGTCGGGFSKVNHERYACSTARNKGTCENRLSMKRDDIERSVLHAIQHKIMAPNALALFCEQYMRHWNELRAERNANIHSYRAELEKLARGKKKIVEAIIAGVPGSEVKDDMNEIVRRRTELEMLLDQTDEIPVLLHPKMADHYKRQVGRLVAALESGSESERDRNCLRTLIDKITLTPNTTGNALQVDLYGNLAGILAMADEAETPSQRAIAAGGRVKLVGPAGLRLEYREISADPHIGAPPFYRQVEIKSGFRAI